MLVRLLQSVTDEDLFRLLAHLGLGDVLATPKPARSGSTLRFAMKGPDGVEDLVVEFATRAVSFELRNWKQ